jgi:hypothetical protein
LLSLDESCDDGALGLGSVEPSAVFERRRVRPGPSGEALRASDTGDCLRVSTGRRLWDDSKGGGEFNDGESGALSRDRDRRRERRLKLRAGFFWRVNQRRDGFGRANYLFDAAGGGYGILCAGVELLNGHKATDADGFLAPGLEEGDAPDHGCGDAVMGDWPSCIPGKKPIRRGAVGWMAEERGSG